MDQVAIQFHKNVRLLTEIFEPHEEFKKYFKEGMFDKPNTQGFIHVSFYLLKIYHKDNIKDKIQWPIICKQTETKFRNDVKECLMVISKEHPDVNFPPIIPSHLLLAKGTKFMLIMYKLSLVVLRLHLARVHNLDILLSPKPNPGQESVKIFLRTFTRNQKVCVEKINREKENMEKKARNFCKKKSIEKNKLKEKVFRLKEKLDESIAIAPTNESAKKRLKNSDDTEIIDAWLRVLNKEFIPLIEKRFQIQESIDVHLKSVCNILSNLKGETQTLNRSNFDQINVDFIGKFLPKETQVLAYNLYTNNNLNLKNFFAILQYLSSKYNSSRSKNLNKFAECDSQLQESNKCLKAVTFHLDNILMQIKSFLSSELNQNDEFNNVSILNNSVTEFDKVLFMPSPPIKVNSFDEENQNINQNHLKLTPIEGAHKKLFSRHALDSERSMKYTKEKLPYVQRINFDEAQSVNSSFEKSFVQQKFYLPTRIKPTFKYAKKYSRLFATPKPVSNNSMKMSSSEKSILPLMSKEHCISFSDSCNLSQDSSQESLLAKPNLKSTTENSKQNEEKVIKNKNKRRSITDLVERYKNLIQKSESSPVSFHKKILLNEE